MNAAVAARRCSSMSDQQPTNPQWAAFSQEAAALGARYGLQALVIGAIVPSGGGFGPSEGYAQAWLYGKPPEQFIRTASEMLAAYTSGAAQALLSAIPPVEAAPVEGEPVVEAEPTQEEKA